MPRKARHLEVLEDSKKEKFNLYISCQKTRKNIRNIVKVSRHDDHKYMANLYAITMGFRPPNILNYEKS